MLSKNISKVLITLLVGTSLLCGCSKETMDDNKSDVVIVENEDYNNKDIATIPKSSVFYGETSYNITENVYFVIPDSAAVGSSTCLYQNEDIELSYKIQIYSNINYIFENSDNINHYIDKSFTSMDDASAIYMMYAISSAYERALYDLGVEDSLAYVRDVYTVNNVDYFAIKDIYIEENKNVDFVFVIDGDTMSMIRIIYNPNNETSVNEKNCLIKTLIGKTYVKIKDSYKTELYLWRPAPTTITLE